MPPNIPPPRLPLRLAEPPPMPPIIDPARLNDLEMIQQFSDVISVDNWS
jgi:hypothetical protein